MSTSIRIDFAEILLEADKVNRRSSNTNVMLAMQAIRGRITPKELSRSDAIHGC